MPFSVSYTLLYIIASDSYKPFWKWCVGIPRWHSAPSPFHATPLIIRHSKFVTRHSSFVIRNSKLIKGAIVITTTHPIFYPIQLT